MSKKGRPQSNSRLRNPFVAKSDNREAESALHEISTGPWQRMRRIGLQVLRIAEHGEYGGEADW